MARIYLDARAASGVASGVGRYCSALIPELVAQAPQHEFIVLRTGSASPPLAEGANVREVAVGGRSAALPLLLSARRLHGLFASAGAADLFHALFHLVPFGLRRGAHRPAHTVVTLHDLIWLDHPEMVEPNRLMAAWRRRLALTAIPYALRTADHVIGNSETTLQNARRWVDAERCTAIHLGVGAEFRADPGPTASRAGTIPGPCVAAFGVPKAYKNIGCLVRAMAMLSPRWPALRLVLVGGDGGVPREIAAAALDGRITVTGRLTDAELRDVVRGADVFVVPSTVEGFGLPVVEAMALGTPVVISNIAALSEVAGGAALAFDPASPSGLAAALERLLGDESLRREMATRGRQRATQFSWPDAAARTLAVYERILR